MTFVVQSLLSPELRRRTLEEDLRAGLTAASKWLSPIWLYDETGSQLFDEITRVEEYYPTRREQAILSASATEIVETAQCDVLVELGSGTSEKTRTLLDAMSAASLLAHFVALDVSEEILVASAAEIHADYNVDVTAVVADFQSHLRQLPDRGRRLFAFLGGTIGNFDPSMRSHFFADLRAAMAPGDFLLLGTDLVKEHGRLVAAYDDAAGVTAAFNRNVLQVVNNEFDADFVPTNFAHIALFDVEHSRIEMRLRARDAQHVVVKALGLELDFAAGEEMRTEISTKFEPAALDAELEAAGFVIAGRFSDPDGDFRVTLVGSGVGRGPI